MYSEDDYIQLSAIQHYVFCPRQCALIHVYGIWQENLFTAKGKILHEKVDSGEDESRGDKIITRSLNIYSRYLGLSGRCDVVEITEKNNQIKPYPVEYKSGKPKNNISDMAQLCAQALCLEEMMGVPVPDAAIFYGRPRRRELIEINNNLRDQTREIILHIHSMIQNRIVPEAKYGKKCDTCSLNNICMPKAGHKKLKKYIEELYKQNEETS